MSKASIFTGHQALRADPHLFKDDVDIRFSRTLNSCKLPQIRYATPERLLQRLTDLRFLSIDFLNTFLLTYRVFTGEFLGVQFDLFEKYFLHRRRDRFERLETCFLWPTYGRTLWLRAANRPPWASLQSERQSSPANERRQLRFR